MNFSRYAAWIIIIVSIIVSGSCKKSANVEEARQSFDREGLKFIQMPIGRYFIYKDSATGRLDSVIVTKSILEQKHVAANNCGVFCFASHPAYHYEKFSIVLTNGPNQIEWLSATTGDIIAYSITDDRSPIF